MIGRRTIAGRSVNPVGLGCMSLSWAYGAPPPEADALRLLNQALDLGYDHFDTANIYGLGHNETLVGKALSSRRDEFFLATKMGIVVKGESRGIDCSPDNIRRSIDESLIRLQTDHVDLYYMHRPDPKVPVTESMGAMAELVAAGKIGAVGVSEWSAASIREAHKVHPIAAVQTEYSIWSRNAEIAVLETCRDLGIAFVAFSPVGRGALANALSDIEQLGDNDFRRGMPRFSADNWPTNRALIDQLCAIAKREGKTPAQLALGWVHGRGDHLVSIPGTTAIAHLEENIAAWDWSMPDALAAELSALFDRSRVAGERYSGVFQSTVGTETFPGEI